MTAKALLDRNPQPTDAQIRQGMARHAVPLHDLLPHPGGHQARRRRRRTAARRPSQSKGWWHEHAPRLHQAVGPARRRPRRACRTRSPIRSRAPRRPAWGLVRIPTSTSASSTRGSSSGPDNTATFYVGKTDLGQGTGTAFRQIMADELDMAYERTSVVMGTHRRHRRSGRLGRLGCDPDRRLADAPRRRRGAARAARHGRRRASACRSPSWPSATASSRWRPIPRGASPTAS